MRGSSLKFGVRSTHFTSSCCVFDSPRLLHFLLLVVCLLYYRLVFRLAITFIFHDVVDKIPCALLLMRTLAPLPSTTLSHKISEIRTLQRSAKDPWNGLCPSKKWQGNQLGHSTRTCTKFRFRILRIDVGSSNGVPRAMLLQLLWELLKRGNSLRSFISYDE